MSNIAVAGTEPTAAAVEPLRIVVSGSSGLIGSALVDRLRARGHDVVRLVRRAPARPDEIAWDPPSGALQPSRLDGASVVINLAGAPIGTRRWSSAYKSELVRSRIAGTALLAARLSEMARPPKQLVSSSAIGFYGDRGDDVLDESSGPGGGFLAELCQRWEQATEPARSAGITVTTLRTGIVLAAGGGALAPQLPVFRFGLGAAFGTGRQWVSWIHLDDELAAIERLLHRPVDGPVNLTAPHPVTNAEFVDTLAAVLRRPHLPPLPALVPKVLLGCERAEHLLLHSQRVLPARLAESGFTFRHARLRAALAALVN